MISVSAEELKNKFSHAFINIYGNLKASVNLVLPPDIAKPQVLTFVSTDAQLKSALTNKASIIIANKKLIPQTPELSSEQALLTCEQINLCMSSVLSVFDQKKNKYLNPQIHPTAIIEKGAQVGKNVHIQAHAYIGAGAIIGDNCFIGANTVIETLAQIGHDCIIHPLVFIGTLCVVGNYCEIHPHTTIGSDGYGYATDKNQMHQKIPQIGNVVLEDYVEIASGCAIDRATLTSTRIGMGTKMDNLCHIAHNVEIGKGCFITGMFSIAGSSKIGDFFVCGGKTGIGDHVHIAEKVMLAGATVVLNDIKEPGAYGGFPVQPMKEYLKTQASLIQLTQIRKQVHKILKHLGIEEQ